MSEIKQIIERVRAIETGEGLYILLRPPINHAIITDTNLTSDHLRELADRVEKYDLPLDVVRQQALDKAWADLEGGSFETVFNAGFDAGCQSPRLSRF